MSTQNGTRGFLGYLDGDEFKLRCPFCGDTDKDLNKTHFSVNVISGLYHCYRCGQGGHYEVHEIEALTHESFSKTLSRWVPEKEVDFETIVSNIQPGFGQTHRVSYVNGGWILLKNEIHDLFFSRDSLGYLLGFHLRSVNSKKFIHYGHRLLGYGGANLGEVIREFGYLVLVEGPYDCVLPNYVCSFGFPSKAQCKNLLGVPLIYLPDGDVWKDPNKAYKALKASFYLRRYAILKGIGYIGDGLDPEDTSGNFDLWDLSTAGHMLQNLIE